MFNSAISSIEDLDTSLELKHMDSSSLGRGLFSTSTYFTFQPRIGIAGVYLPKLN